MHSAERSVIRVAARWMAAAPSPGRITKAGLQAGLVVVKVQVVHAPCKKRPAGGGEGSAFKHAAGKTTKFWGSSGHQASRRGTENSWYQKAM